MTQPDPRQAPGSTRPTVDREAAAAGGPRVRSEGEHLRRVIRRGKRWDRLFGITGAVLIFASLGVLAVLIADLIRAGAPQLMHSHVIKERTGYPPSFLTDVTGRLVARPAAGGGERQWALEPDALPLHAAELGPVLGVPPGEVESKLAALQGQRVLVQGLPPDPGGPGMLPERITPLAADAPEGKVGARVHRNAMAGTIEGGGGKWRFKAEPLTLATEDVHGAHLEQAEGKRVAVTKKPALRREVGRLAASDVSTLRERPFVLSMPASTWYQAGILAAAVGTLLVMVVTLCTALPLGIGAGVYLEEYGRKNWLTAIVEINIANLAGVPSIIWGLLGLGLFVYLADLGHSVLTAGLTLGLLVLPIVIIATREAIRAVPATIRDASFALGATKWQTVRNHVLPYSMSGILTGSIVALSRAIGETAPLIVIGAVVYLDFLPPAPVQRVAVGAPRVEQVMAEAAKPDAAATTAPAAEPTPAATQVAAISEAAPGQETELRFQPFAWLRSPFTVLPIQMFDWTSRPEREFHRNAAAAGLVLIVMTLGLNSVAIYLRSRLRRKINW